MPTVTFEDLANMKREILSATAPASIISENDKNTKFRRNLSSNMTIERMFFGPQVIDDVAIDSGAVKADKLEANLVLSTNIIAGAATPANRLELSATGLKAYGTVSGTPNTNTLSIENDGDFTFGTGANQITFVASTGTLSVPAAVISSLTIADVGTGVIGGTYSTQAFGSARIELGQTFFRAYNSAGNRTVQISGSTGEIELSSDPVATSRMDLSADGIELWKSGTRQFYLQVGVTNAITMLLTGPGVGEYIGMNPTDGFWLGASTFAGAATKFRVTPLGALEATSATISGAITATSGNITGNMGISGILTMGSGGLIRTSATTTRLEMDDTGIYGYNAGTARFQVLNNGSGFLGASTTFSWTSAGAVTLAGFSASSTTLSSGSGGSFVTMSSGATAFSAGGATPSSAPFRVTSGGALTATSLSAGTLTITGTASFSGGSLTLPSGGVITSSTLDLNSGTMANLTIDGDITVGSGGKIKFGSGATDYLDNNILHFEVGASETAFIEIMNGSGDRRAEFTGLGGATTGQVAMSAFSNSFPSTTQATVYANLGSSAATSQLLSLAGGATAYVSAEASGAGSVIAMSADAFDFNAMGYTAVALGAYVGKIAVGNIAGSTGYIPIYR